MPKEPEEDKDKHSVSHETQENDNAKTSAKEVTSGHKKPSFLNKKLIVGVAILLVALCLGVVLYLLISSAAQKEREKAATEATQFESIQVLLDDVRSSLKGLPVEVARTDLGHASSRPFST